MGLFEQGNFVLASGLESSFKIDCDALSDSDIAACAYMLASKIQFKVALGVPTGGLRLATAMMEHANDYSVNGLVVDDVWTTGGSAIKYWKENLCGTEGVLQWYYVAIFDRSKDINGPISLFKMS